MAKIRQKRSTIRPPEMAPAPKKRKPGGGRPKSPEGSTQDATLMIRLNAKLKERIMEHVQSLGQGWTVSTWLRQVAEDALS